MGMFKKYTFIPFFFNEKFKKTKLKNSNAFSFFNLVFFFFSILLFKSKKSYLNLEKNKSFLKRISSRISHNKNQKQFIQKYNFNLKRQELNFFNLKKKRKLRTKNFFLWSFINSNLKLEKYKF